MDYTTYMNNRINDLDKITTYLPELSDQMTILRGMIDKTKGLCEPWELIRVKFCEMLDRDVHPAEVDVLLPLFLNNIMTEALDNITDEDFSLSKYMNDSMIGIFTKFGLELTDDQTKSISDAFDSVLKAMGVNE